MRFRVVLSLWSVLLSLFLLSCISRSQSMRTPVHEAMMTNNAFLMPDGYLLPYRVWRPSEEVRAVLVVLHGFNDHSRFFEDAGVFLSKQGILSYAYDQRGFGRTSNPGIWPGSKTLVTDAYHVLDLVSQNHPKVPIYLLGASMGGAVLLSLMATELPLQERVEGTILVSPAVWGRSGMSIWYRMGLWFGRTFLPGLNVFPPKGLSITPSDNQPMLQELALDPLFIRGTRLDALQGIVGLMDEAIAAAPSIHRPTLILFGANEQIIPPKLIDLFIPKLLPNKVRLAFYPKGYHMLLRDLNASIVYQDILSWITDQRADLPSGTEIELPLNEPLLWITP